MRKRTQKRGHFLSTEPAKSNADSGNCYKRTLQKHPCRDHRELTTCHNLNPQEPPGGPMRLRKAPAKPRDAPKSPREAPGPKNRTFIYTRLFRIQRKNRLPGAPGKLRKSLRYLTTRQHAPRQQGDVHVTMRKNSEHVNECYATGTTSGRRTNTCVIPARIIYTPTTTYIDKKTQSRKPGTARCNE